MSIGYTVYSHMNYIFSVTEYNIIKDFTIQSILYEYNEHVYKYEMGILNLRKNIKFGRMTENALFKISSITC
jgi:hypothetical protein